MLGIAGAWPGWRIEGVEIKAVLAYSPYCSPFVKKRTLGRLTVPVLYQGGTRDTGTTPSVKRPDGAYAQTGGRAAFVELDNANHFAWSDGWPEYQATIVHYTLGFLAAHLDGAPAAPMTARFGKAIDVRVK